MIPAVIDNLLFAFWSPGPAEMLVLAVVALLLYGGNLPEVARSWGKSFAEFRRGLSGFQNELNDVMYSEPEQIPYRDDTYVDQGYDDQGYDDQGDDDTQEGADDDGLYTDTSGQSGTGDNTESAEAEAEPEQEIDDSEQTVRNVGADTVIIDDVQEKPQD